MKPVDPKSLSGLHLYMHPYSNCAQRVMLALAEKGLNAEMHQIGLMGGEQLSDAYRAINPDCDVPALVHDGLPMHDSITILRYLEKSFPEPSLTPKDPKERQEMERLLDEASASHMGGLVPWVYASGIGRLPTPKQREFYEKHIPHRAKFFADRRAGKVGCDKQAAQAVLHEQFSRLDAMVSEQDWLLASGFSLADIAWAPNAIVLEILGFDLAPYPHLRQWLIRIRARLSWQSSIQPHLIPVPSWFIRLVARTYRKFGNRY